ncbi:Uncharacterized protein FWK35_00006463 [Aphis craccivora]|uniref:Uncharacterized protein n=1 Tax=Aphis craccivora TaxID=307492 RepID=A0A6G0YBU8_APHCR|nr:Uncharacterized protein FWK35_00006463 [Aphis craccivora]
MIDQNNNPIDNFNETLTSFNSFPNINENNNTFSVQIVDDENNNTPMLVKKQIMSIILNLRKILITNGELCTKCSTTIRTTHKEPCIKFSRASTLPSIRPRVKPIIVFRVRDIETETKKVQKVVLHPFNPSNVSNSVW